LKLIVLDVISNYLAGNLGIPLNIGVIRKRTGTQHRITFLLENGESKAKYYYLQTDQQTFTDKECL